MKWFIVPQTPQYSFIPRVFPGSRRSGLWFRVKPILTLYFQVPSNTRCHSTPPWNSEPIFSKTKGSTHNENASLEVCTFPVGRENEDGNSSQGRVCVILRVVYGSRIWAKSYVSTPHEVAVSYHRKVQAETAHTVWRQRGKGRVEYDIIEHTLWSTRA